MNHDKNPAIFFVPGHKAKPSQASQPPHTYFLMKENTTTTTTTCNCTPPEAKYF
jgi:hypothetical protein